MDQKRKKMLLTGVLVLLALSAAFVLLLRDQGEEILSALRELTWTGVLCLLLMSGAYQLAESFICRTIVRTRIPDFPLFSAWKTVHLKVFGDVASFGTASLPLQMYFLHQNGLPAGAAMGQMTLEYIFHKGSILLYATVMLCAQWPWLMETARSVTVYLLPAYGICALIIASLWCWYACGPAFSGAPSGSSGVCRSRENGPSGRPSSRSRSFFSGRHPGSCFKMAPAARRCSC